MGTEEKTDYRKSTPEVLYQMRKTVIALFKKQNVFTVYFALIPAMLLGRAAWGGAQMLFLDFDTRLAIHLVQESERVGSSRIRTTHEKIARNIGSAREVVTRMLKKFSDAGLVEVRRGAVVILNMDELRKMVPGRCE